MNAKGKRGKKALLKYLQEKRIEINNSHLAGVISYAMYYDEIERHIPKMLEHIQERIKEIQEVIL